MIFSIPDFFMLSPLSDVLRHEVVRVMRGTVKGMVFWVSFFSYSKDIAELVTELR